MKPQSIDSSQYSIQILERDADFSTAAADIQLGIYSSIFILCDTNTEKHCYSILISKLPELEKAHLIVLRAGEKHKTLESCSTVWQELLEQKADRRSLIMNLGGGVIGDLGGFCAATYMRGIDFIQIPTTLLAMVDASAGGKTAIDFNYTKNCIGAFSNPISVWIFSDFLFTLPPYEFNSGMAEVIKHYILDEPNGLDKGFRFQANNPENWAEMIFHSVSFKNRIVESDFKEHGPRKILNLGHTVGHAIESYSHVLNTPISHGEAVAAGMIIESIISFNRESFSQRELDQLVDLIDAFFPRLSEQLLDIKALEPFLFADKKNRNQSILMVLLDRIGHPQYDIPVEIVDIETAIEAYKAL